ncbi:disease resistance protein Roq1-like isoform X2 [Castanea sativa]|uniref:disease resistance protein Roq1-like isoform X2 n=1 Tax=Castanea sativa TaxID=21020 RepID=UPI003F64B0CA
MKGHTIFPVFYDVEPTEVRKQKGSFGEAFAKHDKENLEKVERWRDALAEVANISGWVVPKGQESEYIEPIVEKIFKTLSSIKLNEGLVGIDSRVWEVYSCLKIGLTDVRMIGIYGTGGIGKTAIAQVVYDSFSNQFEASSFLHNVRETAEREGLAYLQEQLLSDIFVERNIRISDVDNGARLIRHRLFNKKVLLILDDVDCLDQLYKLACKRDWFRPGSRIVITTRDEHLLKTLEVDEIHRPKELSSEEAVRLLSLTCFGSEHPPEDNHLWMHPLVQQMGREIILRESPKFPWKRSRLWLPEDIDLVLTDNMGTEAIESIVLDLPTQKEVHWHPEAFSKMHCLVLLKIHNVQLQHELTHFPNGLRFVEWSGYSLKSLPPNFEPKMLVELTMCHSNIELLWKGVKQLDSLRFIKLSHSRNLVRTPDFSEARALERIDFEGCPNLIEVHPSVGVLKHLIFLNLKDCTSLVSLPNKLEMETLEIFSLSGCSKVKKIPEFTKNMERLQELHVNGTAIVDLPSSIEHLTGLSLLNISHCKNLVHLPCAILRLELLRDFIVLGCSRLATFDDHEILPSRKRSIWLWVEEFFRGSGRRVKSKLS